MQQVLSNLLNSDNKADQTKAEIIKSLVKCEKSITSDIAREFNLSNPTVNKFIGELVSDGLVVDYGKLDSNEGRKPLIYGLNPSSVYFVGIGVYKHFVSIGVINISGQLVHEEKYKFTLENTEQSFEKLIDIINSANFTGIYLREKIAGYCIAISGRINSKYGLSYSYFNFGKKPLAELFQERLGAKVFIDNDSRASCYGEYITGNTSEYGNMLYINTSWGLGMGMILNGKLFYGNSGFSGDFGHIYMFDNEIFCHCGKKGCLETEASGSAMYRILSEQTKAGALSVLSDRVMKGEIINTEDMVNAAINGDMLMIDIIEEIGSNLGRGIAALINIFNPGYVVIGGVLSVADEFLIYPIKSAVKKYSISLINKDTNIIASKLGGKAGMVGACYLARDRFLKILTL